MRPSELTSRLPTQAPDTGSSIGRHSSPTCEASFASGKLKMYPSVGDWVLQPRDTAALDKPSWRAASLIDGRVAHSVDPTSRNMTGLLGPPLHVRDKLAYEYWVFWLCVTYSKFAKQLFPRSPSMWCTCHASADFGRPLKVIITILWTVQFCPRIKTCRYPEEWSVP